MKVLGYPRTWPTKCFINGGCGAKTFAHTGGFGDFVLFDALGDPWPVHDCYVDRFGTPGGAGFDADGPFGIDAPGVPDKDWEYVRDIVTDAAPSGRIGVVGQVFELTKGALANVPGFAALSNESKEKIRGQLQGRTALATIDTGDGWRYVAFVDHKKYQIRVGDTITADLKKVSILAGTAFKITQIKMCWRNGRPLPGF